MAMLAKDLLDRIELREPQACGNLTLIPLFIKAEEREAVTYLLLEEALKMGCLEIGEVSQEGDVNTVVIINNSGQPVLILDGEEILGAKQNRMVNATILIPVKKKVEVPVSCVERGRWRYRSPGFDKAGAFGYTTLRKQKAQQVSYSLKCVQEFKADQGAIWAEIERKQAKMNTSSETDALHDVYHKYEDVLQSVISTLEPQQGQVGVAVLINNRFTCLDLFDHPDTLSKLWAKLLKSYAMEAIEAKDEKKYPLSLDPQNILNSIGSSECSTYPSVGLGSDLRLSGAGIFGAGLALEDRILHLSVFENEPV